MPDTALPHCRAACKHGPPCTLSAAGLHTTQEPHASAHLRRAASRRPAHTGRRRRPRAAPLPAAPRCGGAATPQNQPSPYCATSCGQETKGQPAARRRVHTCVCRAKPSKASSREAGLPHRRHLEPTSWGSERSQRALRRQTCRPTGHARTCWLAGHPGSRPPGTLGAAGQGRRQNELQRRRQRRSPRRRRQPSTKPTCIEASLRDEQLGQLAAQLVKVLCCGAGGV